MSRGDRACLALICLFVAYLLYHLIKAGWL